MLRPVGFSLSFSGDAAEYKGRLVGKTVTLDTSGPNRRLYGYLFPDIHTRPGQRLKVTNATGYPGHYKTVEFVPIYPCRVQKNIKPRTTAAINFNVVG